MHYYGTRLSENISKREPEGYLLCLNVPVARSGTQEYLPEELGLQPSSSVIQVYRPEEEVFSPETMASFEGMPVTNDHPPDGVDVSNIRALQKGHAHNVRRGSGDESDLLLADLIITDPQLIHLILDDGKREISCGYTYELHEENGQYIQRKIRGNHVAVVDAGRAGPRVSIKDSMTADPATINHFASAEATRAFRCPGPSEQMEKKNKISNDERSNKNMKKSLAKILARMAKDGDIETVAEFIEEMIETETPAGEGDPNEGDPSTSVGMTTGKTAAAVAEAVEAAAEDPAAVVETEEGTTIVVDEATLGEVIARLDQIIALLTPAAEDEEPTEEIAEIVEEALEAVTPEASAAEGLPLEEGTTAEEIAAVVEEILDPLIPEEGETVGDEEDDPEEGEVLSTGDALRFALMAVGPKLARLPEKQRVRVCADISARLNGRRRKGKTGKDASARKKGKDPTELGKRIMAKRSANRQRR